MFTVTTNEVHVVGLPIADNALTIESYPDDGDTIYWATIAQRQGRYLDLVYVNQDVPYAKDDITSIVEIAAITGRRLAAVA